MSQNVEIEFKNMLTKEEYEHLLNEFNIKKDHIFTQENHYFDTPDFALKEKGAALRIRLKKEFFEMTLKQPLSVGLLETNQTLTENEAHLAIYTEKLPNGSIEKLIENMGISFSNIKYFGSLKTERAEIKFNQGLLVLDHSIYLNKEDFELEYEVKDYLSGKEAFKNLLSLQKIPERKTDNKIRRFYNQKRCVQNSD